jgi:hypothetical protein
VTAPIPSVEPTSFAAGETVLWTKAVANYPSTDGWSLIYSIRGPANFPDVTASAQADGTYSINIPVTTTTPLTAGGYSWVSHAYKAGPPIERYRIANGVIVVLPDLTVTGLTVLSHAAKMLPLIEALIEGRVPKDVQRYVIGNRQLDKIPIRELYLLRNFYRAEVARERRPTKANPGRVVSFVKPR